MAVTQDTTSNGKIRVMLVDDSAVIRGLISRALEKDPAIQVVATAHNGQAAVDSVKRADPDVIVLDIEMPVMDGITALPLLLKEKPDAKVLICSTLSTKGATVSLKALELGATECLAKPSSTGEISSTASEFQDELVRLTKALGPKHLSAAPASGAGTSTAAQPAQRSTTGMLFSSKDIQLHDDRFSFRGKPDILAIGSSTGGPQALTATVKHFKDFDIPIVVTQHMPKTFTRILAQNLAQTTGIPAHEGEEGMRLENGHIYIAPGGLHMLFERVGSDTVIRLDDGPQENFCKPAVDPMLRSLVKIYDKKILTVILTGMGFDGKKGAMDVVEHGGRVIAQDENTSVVWGMPGAVATAGVCSAILPIDEIGPWVKKAVMGL